MYCDKILGLGRENMWGTPWLRLHYSANVVCSCEWKEAATERKLH